MYSDMNEGTVIHGRTETEIERTHFFLGAVTTNHKRNENEVMPQLLKLRKKVENGARFIVNQIGYNARKDHELLQWVASRGCRSACWRTCSSSRGRRRASSTPAGSPA